jgi:hypothetical protein
VTPIAPPTPFVTPLPYRAVTVTAPPVRLLVFVRPAVIVTAPPATVSPSPTVTAILPLFHLCTVFDSSAV